MLDVDIKRAAIVSGCRDKACRIFRVTAYHKTVLLQQAKVLFGIDRCFMAHYVSALVRQNLIMVVIDLYFVILFFTF